MWGKCFKSGMWSHTHMYYAILMYCHNIDGENSSITRIYPHIIYLLLPKSKTSLATCQHQTVSVDSTEPMFSDFSCAPVVTKWQLRLTYALNKKWGTITYNP
jgi:hypothetical protein